MHGNFDRHHLGGELFSYQAGDVCEHTVRKYKGLGLATQQYLGAAVDEYIHGQNTHEQMQFRIINMICKETLSGKISTTLTTNNEAASDLLAFSKAFHDDFLHFRVTFATTQNMFSSLDHLS